MGQKYAVLFLILVGCAHTAKPEPEPNPEPEPKPAPDPLEYALFDGKTGEKIDVETLAARVADVRFLAFGELHRNPAGSLVQKQLFDALAEHGRPVVLAMEFLERDTQGVVDRFLSYSIEEQDFVAWSRQGKGYETSHGPLIDICREQEWVVVAANAPRRLATEFRKSDQDYAEFLESLTEAERSYLPRGWSDMPEAEQGPFFAAMGGHKTAETASFTRSMALWDDAMAEACADACEAHPDALVVLVVGAFHVARGAQTARKFRERRPDDACLILVSQFGELAFTPEDEGKGDFVLKVRPPEPTKGDGTGDGKAGE